MEQRDVVSQSFFFHAFRFYGSSNLYIQLEPLYRSNSKQQLQGNCQLGSNSSMKARPGLLEKGFQGSSRGENIVWIIKRSLSTLEEGIKQVSATTEHPSLVKQRSISANRFHKCFFLAIINRKNTCKHIHDMS